MKARAPIKRPRTILFRINTLSGNTHTLHLAYRKPAPYDGKSDPIGSTPALSFRYEHTYKPSRDGIGKEIAGSDRTRIHATGGSCGHSFKVGDSKDLHRFIRAIRVEDLNEIAEIEKQLAELYKKHRAMIEASFERAEQIDMQQIIADCDKAEEYSKQWQEKVRREKK